MMCLRWQWASRIINHRALNDTLQQQQQPWHHCEAITTCQSINQSIIGLSITDRHADKARSSRPPTLTWPAAKCDASGESTTPTVTVGYGSSHSNRPELPYDTTRPHCQQTSDEFSIFLTKEQSQQCSVLVLYIITFYTHLQYVSSTAIHKTCLIASSC